MKKFLQCLFLILILAVLCGCLAEKKATDQPSLLDQSAQEATSIIQRAQATALVLKAQAQATVLVQSAGMMERAPEVTLLAITPSPKTASPSQTPVAASATNNGVSTVTTVELLSVGFGTDGANIVVNFKAPPEITRSWAQGNLSVTDEVNGTVYNFIPVAPLLGPLFGKPKYSGQIGYVMFVNTPPGLRSGASVTVVLGNFKKEHVIVH